MLSKNICRLCARENNSLYSIFKTGIEVSNNIIEKILYVSSVEVFKDDGLPENICGLCKDKLDAAFDFRHQIISTDEKFRSSMELTIKNESEGWLSEDINVTYIEVKEDYTTDDDTPLQVVFNVELCDSNGNTNKVENKKRKRQTKTRRNYEKQKESMKLTRVCPECGMLLKKHSYADHMMTQHNQERNYECDICGLKLKTKRQLWHHKKKKHEEREKVNCDKCGLNFASRNNFTRHYNNIHLGIKKHICNLCEKAFSHLKTLKQHIRSHTGERPFICAFCDRGFSGAWALKQHIWLHTNEKPYKCSQCSDAFTQNVTLKLHIKRKHMGITPEKEKELKI